MATTLDQRPCAIALMGPTASGKSAYALELAERLGGEIVSVDSALVYRGLDIGAAKPTREEQARVPHHLMDLREPWQPYSAAEFATDARIAIDAIVARGRIPILAGGTGLYFRALLEGLADMPHGRAQRVHRPQRVGARGDDHMGQHANPQRGNVKGLKGEVEMCVVEHTHQGIVVAFDAGGVRALFESLKKRIGQLGVPLYPAQRLGVGQVEVQPDEGSRDTQWCAALHGGRCLWVRLQPVRSCDAVQRQGRRAALHEVAAHQTCRVAAVAVVRQRASRVDCHEMGRQKVQGPGQEGRLPSCAASVTV